MKLIATVLLFVSLASASTTATRSNAFGAVIPTENRNVYMYGSVIGGTIFARGEREFTSLRVQPFHTPSLYDEDILLCGDRSNDFEGMAGPIIITYDRTAHEMVEGIGCYNLVEVNKVVPKGIK